MTCQSSKNVNKKITANSNCLYRGARLQFRGARGVTPGHDGVAGLVEFGIIWAPFIVESGMRRFSRWPGQRQPSVSVLGFIHPAKPLLREPQAKLL
jgi:hypothetical protein